MRSACCARLMALSGTSKPTITASDARGVGAIVPLTHEVAHAFLSDEYATSCGGCIGSSIS
jgi:hypothetical protein